MVEGYSHFGIGYSWGGFESLALTVHPEYLGHIRTLERPTGSLVRYQIGLEHADDLIHDLAEGLSQFK